jgi:CubicO group peptidase (beta-lactamase class C family)
MIMNEKNRNRGGKSRIWLLTVCILACIFPAWSQQGVSRRVSVRNEARVQALLKDLEAKIPERMTKDDLPGLSIALIDKDGLVWAKGFGVTARTSGKPVHPDTVFSIQSISKTFTTTGILKAVQAGILSLDAPITAYLPQFKVNSHLEKNPEKELTLRILLSHRGGFTHEAPVGNNYYPEFPSFEAHVKSISDTWLRYPVGQRYSYSNLGIDLAGYILQFVSRKPFTRAMKENVLDPIGMKNSSFDWETTRANLNRAVGHNKGFSTVPLEFALIPSGALYASAVDMGKYVQFQLNEGRVNGKRVLNQKLLKEMCSVQFPLEGQEEGYGLGISRGKRNGSYLLNHGGGGFGFLSNMTWYPEYGIGLVVLTNSVNHSLMSLPNEILDGILKPYATEVKPAPLLGEAKHETAADDTLIRVLGNYIGRSIVFNIVAQNGKGAVRALEKTVGVLEFKSGSDAVVKMVDGSTGRLRFFFAADGSPSYMVNLDNGDAFDYNDGPNDKQGQDKPEWDRYVGKYGYMTYGQQEGSVTVHKKNGYLYCDRVKLAEHIPGLFFGTTGETFDFRGEFPSWRSIRLLRKK